MMSGGRGYHRTGNLFEEAKDHGRAEKDINADFEFRLVENREHNRDTSFMIAICHIGRNRICRSG